ncbi:single-stranded DNA-binding protein [Promicromonospora soli]
MSISTWLSLEGFVASEPELGRTKNGTAVLRLRVGVEHARRTDDGSFVELTPTFHDLVLYNATAKRAKARLRKGDAFVASGRVHQYTVTRDGQQQVREEFVARRIGHDLARTRYSLDRRRRTAALADGAARRRRREPVPVGDILRQAIVADRIQPDDGTGLASVTTRKKAFS